jgi:hypothetical protein
VKVTGQKNLELQKLAIACENDAEVEIDIGRAKWTVDGWNELYSMHSSKCGSADCLVVTREAMDTSFVQSRDALDREIGGGIWMHMPLAVWSDGYRTYPVMNAKQGAARFAMTDLEVRLGAVISAWGIASLFYPYLADLHIDWDSELPGALSEAAAASSMTQLSHVLFRLVSRLCDNHATIVHPGRPIDGVWPIRLRRFGNDLVVTGVVGEYAKELPVGTVVASIDGVPAIKAYDEMRSRVPAATPGWAAAFVPFWLAASPALEKHSCRPFATISWPR